MKAVKYGGNGEPDCFENQTTQSNMADWGNAFTGQDVRGTQDMGLSMHA
jgi:hypothetical protein